MGVEQRVLANSTMLSDLLGLQDECVGRGLSGVVE
jgi:hypothetical protein